MSYADDIEQQVTGWLTFDSSCDSGIYTNNLADNECYDDNYNIIYAISDKEASLI